MALGGLDWKVVMVDVMVRPSNDSLNEAPLKHLKRSWSDINLHVLAHGGYVEHVAYFRMSLSIKKLNAFSLEE